MQEALLAAAMHWPAEGLPDNPRGWLIQTAVRRLTDQYRSEAARRRREESAALREVPGAEPVQRDDTLVLLFTCCHPALTPASSIALALRAVAGLTTAEIATAFLNPSQPRTWSCPFLPPRDDQDDRLIGGRCPQSCARVSLFGPKPAQNRVQRQSVVPARQEGT